MSKPELWTAPGPADEADAITDGWERERKAEGLGLRRVPFDEAVERMANVLAVTHGQEHPVERDTDFAAYLLRAALREGT